MSSIEEGPSEAVALEAQQIHTDVYLDRGYIQPEELREDGIYIDEYTPRSEPILVKLGAKETTVRIIHADKKNGMLSLPTPKHFAIDTAALKEVAHVSRLADIGWRDVVELSGLASIRLADDATTEEKFDATRQAYAAGLRHSLDQGHALWVMNVDNKLMKFLELTLGKDSYTQIGEKQEYMGPATTPIALNPQDIVKSILLDQTSRFGEANREDISLAMQGVSEKHLSRTLIKLLKDNDIETTKNSVASKLWMNKKAALYGSIVGYSALRFLPVMAVEQFHGSVAAFAGIDIATAVTQVGSMELFFSGKNRAVRTLGALGTGASFAAPYAYFWANGEDYPPYVNAIAGGFVAIGVGIEASKTRTDIKVRHGLETTDLPTA
ncbi:MAG: hypothetical protein ABIP50_01885 [Candidatus Saccharimonadales bacterium]